ncbi:MAG: YbjQ family protein [Deltaproteobacteria bacterium]|nr:YbjQ family protein [Deltaproteobacteria bacterium]
MDAYFSIFMNIGLPLLIIIIAVFTGSILEKRHFQSIEKREKEMSGIPVLNGKKYPGERPVEKAELVSGSVVISIDYFKKFLAGLRQIFGGEIKSYVSLVDRGRREAILRMKEKCRDADLIVNFRIKTSSISKGRKNKIGSVEVYAYGTAIKFK